MQWSSMEMEIPFAIVHIKSENTAVICSSFICSIPIWVSHLEGNYIPAIGFLQKLFNRASKLVNVKIIIIYYYYFFMN